MKSKAAGFTLIELLVTLAVVTILLTLGMPAFGNLQQRNRAANAHHLLTTSLAIARLTAVQRGEPVSVCPSTDGTRCRNDVVWDDGWIVFADPARANQPASAAAVLQRVDPIGNGLALRSTAGRTRVRFNPSGWAYGSNLSVRLCTTQGQQHLGSVIVNNAGRPRSEFFENKPCPYALSRQ